MRKPKTPIIRRSGPEGSPGNLRASAKVMLEIASTTDDPVKVDRIKAMAARYIEQAEKADKTNG